MWKPRKPLGRKRDACRVLGISLRTLDRMIASGEVEFLRIGRQVRFDMDKLTKGDSTDEK